MGLMKDTYFVIKNGVVQQPLIPKDGLELYYDVKGKRNTDNYKGTLLDMSGKGRHGTLSNFAYEGVSGFAGTTEGGLLLDDVDDKIVRPAISGIEYTSASRNLFDINLLPTGVSGATYTKLYNGYRVQATTSAAYRHIYFNMILEPNTSYKISFTAVTTLGNAECDVYSYGNIAPSVGDVGFTTPIDGKVSIRFYCTTVDAAMGDVNFTNIQLEKGSVATPYTPYIPLPIMTYQMNGNILSFEKDGTVKRTTKDANGNEVVVSRKGINLVRNGNFANGKTYWQNWSNALLSVDSNVLRIFNLSGYFQGYARSVYPIFPVITHNTKIYMECYARVTNSVADVLRVQPCYSNSGTPTSIEGVYSISSPVENVWYKLSSISTFRDTDTYWSFQNITTIILHKYANKEVSNGKVMELYGLHAIDLTEAYGAGNEPTLEYIQSHPEEFAWTPNPNDLIETVEIKNNLVGDLENLQGNDFEQHEDGVITYTNEAEEGSVVRVDIDGISDQPLRFRNATGEQVVITEHDQTDEDAIKKVEFQGNSVQLADKYREVNGTSVVIAPELHDKNVADKLVIGGNTTQYTESSNVVTDGLQMWLSGRNFSNSPATTVWKDLTGMNNGTASGFAFTTASGSDGNGGVVFDGVDDKIEIPHSNKLSIKPYFSVLVRFKAKSWNNASGNSYPRLISKGTLYDFQIEGNSTGSYMKLNTSGAGITITQPFLINTDYELVFTYDGINMKGYVNGLLISTVSALSYMATNSDNLFIGCRGDNARFFDGKITKVLIYSKALTDAEVLQNYNAGLSIPIPNIAMSQEVKHVNSGSKVLVHGKNLVISSRTSAANLGRFGGVLNAEIVSLKPNTYYTMSFVGTPGNSVYTNEHIFTSSSPETVTGSRQSITRLTKPILSKSSTFYYNASNGGWLLLKNNQDQASANVFTDLQIEEGSSATAYESFRQTETTIPVTLKSIG